ncbi:MAG: SDR family NAD(P)-dependent oxidoreductase [Butyrivibrio sp.]|nr:SDR family NAD(P)-dependent oxidoreductase [Acetatifactor muris]MCM1560593.1 SDR family NAD(P)-dependent oxidoreductase [Butyrivibrio sp.]
MNIAIVTGASSGLGAEYVRQLDSFECFNEIWVIARRQERLAALQAQVKTRLRPLACDLTKEESIRQLTALLRKKKPNVRVLINCAGFGKIGSYRHIPLEQCQQMIDLNCRAAVTVTQTVLPYMHRGGRILEICSTSAFQPLPCMNVYAASKAFLYRYSRALANELKGTGVRVTAVCPFWVRGTEFISAAKDTDSSRQINNFPLSSRREDVVRRSLQDSRRGRTVSTPGFACTLHRILSKFMPGSLMMAVWNQLRR